MQIKLVLTRNSLYSLSFYSIYIKNWLKHIFVLTAYVWKAAPCSALPTADENAVTESAVTNCLPACSSQPQFLQRMSSCTAKLLTVKLQYVKQPISVPIVYISSVDN